MSVDLHIHSTFSDGLYTPRQLVEMAVASGIEVMAITDHDSVNGLRQAQEAAQELGGKVRVIEGIELGAQVGKKSVHILGYNIDKTNETLLKTIKGLREGRELRLHRMVAKINKLGYNITIEDCDKDNRAVGRPHVAKALVKNGYFDDVEEAFEVLLKNGRPGYEPQPKLSPEEAVKLLHDAGGMAVLAHPAEIEDLNLVQILLKTVDFDGIEVYHPSADKEMQEKFMNFSEEFGLLVSGGSDFHGHSGRFPEKLGVFNIDYKKVQNLIQKCDKI